MYSKKQVKALEKAMSKGLDSPQIIEQEAQGNGHLTLTIEANGQVVTVQGVASTPRDITFTGNKLRQAVRRELKA
jgi:hypothetical protein